MERRRFLQAAMLGAGATILGVAAPVAATTNSLERNAMSDTNRIYEPLTSENAALILIDHQVGLMTGVRDYSTGELKHNVVGLAKAAKLLKLPIIVTTTARGQHVGPDISRTRRGTPRRSHHRSLVRERVRRRQGGPGHHRDRAQEADLRAASPSKSARRSPPSPLSARASTLYVAVDASGTFSETKRQVGLLRMLQAGVILSDYATLMVEILKDNKRPEAGPVYGRHRYALGQARRANRAGLRQVTSRATNPNGAR